MRRMPLIAVTGFVAAGLTLSACGSDSLSSSPGAGSTPAGTAAGGGVDQALAAKVPAKLKSAGKIVVGTDPTYAPNEMLALRRQDRRGLRRRRLQRRGRQARPQDRVRPRRLRLDHPRRDGRQVRRRRLELHHQPGPQEAGQHGELLQRRHPVGRRQGQPREGQHRRRLRQEHRRPEGHRAGRRPRRAQQEVHRRRQARHHADHPGPARTRSPPTSSAARPSPCSPTPPSGCMP